MSFLDDWKEWSTAKKAISIIGVCCIGLIIIGVLMGGGSTDKNTSPTTNTNDTTSANTTPEVKGVQVHVIYDGEWSGALSTGSSTKSISGSGETTLDIDDSGFVVSANAQKQEGSNSKLTIQILKDGKVVEETDTDASYGVAQVTANV